MGPDFLIIAISLVCSAFFSGMEIAFISANKLQIELDSKQGGFNSKILAHFSAHPSRFIGTMLLGNNVALVVYGIYMARILEPWIAHNISSNEGVILLTQTIVSTLLVLVTAEFLPKTIFRINPNRILLLFAVPLLIIYVLFWIPVLITIGLSELIIRLFSKENNGQEQNVPFGKVDLDNYLAQAAIRKDSNEEIDHEVHLFQNALNFSKVKARDCMVPRNEIVAVEMNTPIEELVSRFIETTLSKILVYRDTIDNIIGCVHSFELLKKPDSIKSILLPVNIVPESITVDKALNQLQENNRSIAIVVDEFGGTSGMLTTEDIMEEIFGEIEDEHDHEDLVEHQVSENAFVFSARAEIDYLNEKYALQLPESEEYETLAGYIISLTEDIPDTNEQIETEAFLFTIVEVSNTRINLVRVQKQAV